MMLIKLARACNFTILACVLMADNSLGAQEAADDLPELTLSHAIELAVDPQSNSAKPTR